MSTGRIQLEKSFRFEAAHYLPNHDGKCARMHGHSWVMTVKLEGEAAQLVRTGAKAGMLVDYGDISKIVKPFVDEHLDHWMLNSTTGLQNPTSEELARWCFERLRVELPFLTSVRIEETCTSACTYTEANL